MRAVCTIPCNLAAKESGLECTCVNNDDFTVLVSGDGRRPWVSICTVWLLHSKWLSEERNKSALNLVLRLNLLLWKLFRWFRRPQLWATGDWQLHYNNVSTHTSCLMQSFLVKCQITQVTQFPYRPDLAPCNFWLFPKLKSPLKGRHFKPSVSFRKICWGSWWLLGEMCEVPWCLLRRGLRHHCPVYSVSCIFFNKCLYFHITWLDTFWTDLACACICIYSYMQTYLCT